MKILIVEDELLVAMYLQDCVEDIGHEVVGVASSSRRALAIAEQRRPDLALVDINLTDGRTGIEVVRTLSETMNILAVFVTADRKLVPSDFAGAAGLIRQALYGKRHKARAELYRRLPFAKNSRRAGTGEP